jgi:RHS repeat-associated protein
MPLESQRRQSEQTDNHEVSAPGCSASDQSYYRARYYDAQSGRFLSEDPIRFRGGVDFYSYVNNNPINALDPSGLLVFAVYYQGTGQLTVTDLDTGETVIINVESGGKPFGDPIPPGTYDILEQQRKPDEFRLDKQDETPYDDVDDATGRNHFRLHHPGRTIGCIAAKDWTGWKQAFNLINNTKTKTVPDNFKPWWKFWSSPSSLKDFGTLVVVPRGN